MRNLRICQELSIISLCAGVLTMLYQTCWMWDVGENCSLYLNKIKTSVLQ